MLTATYRLQVHKEFPLARVRELVPYFRDLGISHLYSSPLLKARAGSTHGYDVVDPTQLNPEVGTEEELRALASELHAARMGLVLDIVPNHMGVGPENPYWQDVLTHGQQSRYARWFDIDWDAHPRRRGKVVLPVLGDELEAVIGRGELGLDISESGGVQLKYYENRFPLDPATVPPELQLVQLDPGAEAAAREWVHGDAGRERLRELLVHQHYALAFWRCAPADINYRRFFDINDLAGLRMADPIVFDETHAKILEWVRDGVVDGLRIDHIDGLRDPLGYLTRLRTEVDARLAARGDQLTSEVTSGSTNATSPTANSPFPIFVEKILSSGEHLRREWPVQGTTGYETLNDIESIFIHYDGSCAVERAYRRLRRLADDLTFETVAHEGRLKVLRGALRADVRRLARLLVPVLRELGGRQIEVDGRTLPSKLPRPNSLTERALVDGLTQLLASLPVYRTYIDGRTAEPHPDDRAVIQHAVAAAEAHANEVEHAVVQRVAEVFMRPFDVHNDRSATTSDARGTLVAAPSSPRLEFIVKFQQTSGPATAKGVEDTALYAYVPLASRNEVGGEPDRQLHDAVERFHAANAERARDWPLALVTTNTHDTKRSADVRARIDVLSEVPDEWERCVARWRQLNRAHKTTVRGRQSPDSNAEYLLYQTLIGLWPAAPSPQAGSLPSDEWFASAAERLERYMMKAIKEAKTHTSWTEPDEEFEDAVKRFAHAIVDRGQSADFLADVARFVDTIAPAGWWNALARVLVHLTVPGTPDTYQGDELWNFTLVDPDNRQPVDYGRRRMLEREAASRVDMHPSDERLKLFLVQRALQARRAMPALFREGTYVPLRLSGARSDRVFAFARQRGDAASITIVPRLLIPLLRESARPTGAVWGDTRLHLPQSLAGLRWRSALSDGEIRIERTHDGGTLDLATTFSALPFDLLIADS